MRGVLAIMLPQTSCKAGDRPALMNKVMNLSLRQREGSEKRERYRGKRGYIFNPAINSDKYNCFGVKHRY